MELKLTQQDLETIKAVPFILIVLSLMCAAAITQNLAHSSPAPAPAVQTFERIPFIPHYNLEPTKALQFDLRSDLDKWRDNGTAKGF